MPSLKKLINLTLIAMCSQLYADITLPKVIDGQMILQLNSNAPIWRWPDQGEQDTVLFTGQTKMTGPPFRSQLKKSNSLAH